MGSRGTSRRLTREPPATIARRGLRSPKRALTALVTSRWRCRAPSPVTLRPWQSAARPLSKTQRPQSLQSPGRPLPPKKPLPRQLRPPRRKWRWLEKTKRSTTLTLPKRAIMLFKTAAPLTAPQRNSSKNPSFLRNNKRSTMLRLPERTTRLFNKTAMSPRAGLTRPTMILRWARWRRRRRWWWPKATRSPQTRVVSFLKTVYPVLC